MSSHRLVTMKYLAELAGVSPGLVRSNVRALRSLLEDHDLFSAQEGSGQ